MRHQNNNLIIGINLGNFGSTGNIMINSLKYAHSNGPFDVIACIPYKTKETNEIRIVSFGVKMSKIKHYYYAILRRLKLPIMNDGNYYKENTKLLINIIKQESKYYDSTILHIHNLHMCNLNVSKFYRWLGKNSEYKVLYTLHDCWAFTGGCYYYSHVGCNKWQEKCRGCPQHIKYSSFQLRSRTKLLNKIKNITFINVSTWGNEEFKKSRIKNHPAYINWGETPLQPYYGKSDLKKRLNIIDKKVLLFVSAYWNDWKGVDYIYKLANIIPSEYVIIVIGELDKNDNKNIINIDFLNYTELSEYYTIADAYISVTQAEQLGLTICEAQLSGTPVIGFGNCGSIDTFINGKTGILVENDNIEEMLKAIIYCVENKPFKKEDIIAHGKKFQKYEHAKRMMSIYEKTIQNNNK